MIILPLEEYEQLQEEFDSIVPPGTVLAIQNDQQRLALAGVLKKCENALEKLTAHQECNPWISFLTGMIYQLLGQESRAAALFEIALKDPMSPSRLRSGSLINLLKARSSPKDAGLAGVLLKKSQGLFSLELNVLASLSSAVVSGLDPQGVLALFRPEEITPQEVGYLFIQTLKGAGEGQLNCSIPETVKKTAKRLLREGMEHKILEWDARSALLFLIWVLGLMMVSPQNDEEGIIAALVALPCMPEYASIFGIEDIQGSAELIAELGR